MLYRYCFASAALRSTLKGRKGGLQVDTTGTAGTEQ